MRAGAIRLLHHGRSSCRVKNALRRAAAYRQGVNPG
jgi:hypothetical protein